MLVQNLVYPALNRLICRLPLRVHLLQFGIAFLVRVLFHTSLGTCACEKHAVIELEGIDLIKHFFQFVRFPQILSIELMELFYNLLDLLFLLNHLQAHFLPFLLELLGVVSYLLVCLLQLSDSVVENYELLNLFPFFPLLINLILHVLNLCLRKCLLWFKLVPQHRLILFLYPLLLSGQLLNHLINLRNNCLSTSYLRFNKSHVFIDFFLLFG